MADNINDTPDNTMITSLPQDAPAKGPQKIKTGGTSAHASGKKKEKGVDHTDDAKSEQRRRPGMIVLEPVKGTRDFAPDDMRIRYLP